MRSSRLLLALAFLISIYDLVGQDLEVRATGSGFAISKTGDVVTNQHVVSDCSAVAVKIDGSIERALVIGTDSQKDLALLRIKRQFPSPLNFRSDQRLRLGESITVLGFPLQGLLASSLSLTTGSLSALAGLGDDADMFQFTAPVQPGNSGGPVLDQDGQVIGVVQSKLSTAAAAFLGDIPQNVNFAIRGSVVRSFLDSRAAHLAAAIESTWIVLVLASSVPTTVTLCPANFSGASWSLSV